MNSKLDILPIDACYSLILYLPIQDIVTLSSVSTSFRTDEYSQIHYVITRRMKEILCISWNLPKHYIYEYKLQISELVHLNSVAKSCINGLINNAENLNCRDNSASFTGEVGLGNRSVRSVHSFPFFPKPNTEISSVQIMAHCLTYLFTYAKTRLNWSLNTQEKSLLNSPGAVLASPIKECAFSSPFQLQQMDTHNLSTVSIPPSSCPHIPMHPKSNTPTQQLLYISPRKIAYYEVSVQPIKMPTVSITCTSTVSSTRTVSGMHRTPSYSALHTAATATANTLGNECIAVGLGTSAFPLDSRLPGWTLHSYGFHGDDGAIFHGSGNKFQNFGPKFGLGDTIGCGIDYETKSIFYTLNGSFLGTAFRDVPIDLEFFPTVGIDYRATLDFNFGVEKRFVFDLASFMQTKTAYCTSSTTPVVLTV